MRSGFVIVSWTEGGVWITCFLPPSSPVTNNNQSAQCVSTKGLVLDCRTVRSAELSEEMGTNFSKRQEVGETYLVLT